MCQNITCNARVNLLQIRKMIFLKSVEKMQGLTYQTELDETLNALLSSETQSTVLGKRLVDKQNNY